MRINIIIIILLIGIIINLIFTILNMKNKNIIEPKIEKEQLEGLATDDAYISLSTHMNELDDKEGRNLGYKIYMVSFMTNDGDGWTRGMGFDISENNFTKLNISFRSKDVRTINLYGSVDTQINVNSEKKVELATFTCTGNYNTDTFEADITGYKYIVINDKENDFNRSWWEDISFE